MQLLQVAELYVMELLQQHQLVEQEIRLSTLPMYGLLLALLLKQRKQQQGYVLEFTLLLLQILTAVQLRILLK